MISSARRLLAWSRLEDSRRRGQGTARAGLLAGGGAVLLAGELARRLGAFGGAGDPASASGLVVAAVAAAHVVVFFGAPFRMYWRRDSVLLSRLAITGGALFRLALLRSVRVTAAVALPLAGALAATAPWWSWSLIGRHLALVGLASAAAALGGPAVALGAGALVASSRAQTLIASFGAEVQPPKTSWLGLLPGVGATLLVLALLYLSPWAGGAAVPPGEPALVIGAALALCLGSSAWALWAADRVMPGALREVAALDQERLAHVERTTASRGERLWARWMLRSPGERALFDKDCRLARRRYPSPYFLGPCGVLLCWILAASGAADRLRHTAVVLVLLLAYSLLMARRLAQPPIEQARLLATLPLAPAEVRRAKGRAVLLRVLTWLLLAALPLILTAEEPLGPAALAGVLCLTGVAVGARLARPVPGD
jgi:hypothetical protein